jgi:hypothetical protein
MIVGENENVGRYIKGSHREIEDVSTIVQPEFDTFQEEAYHG